MWVQLCSKTLSCFTSKVIFVFTGITELLTIKHILTERTSVVILSINTVFILTLANNSIIHVAEVLKILSKVLIWLINYKC